VLALEHAVRDCPSQWFQFAPFWPAHADGAATAVPSAPSEIAEPVRVRRG
jgi:hypothetical protein